jgi:hypothetical protein
MQLRIDFHPPACVVAAKSMSGSEILRGPHPGGMPTHLGHEPRRHADPLRHALEDRRNAARMRGHKNQLFSLTPGQTTIHGVPAIYQSKD